MKLNGEVSYLLDDALSQAIQNGVTVLNGISDEKLTLVAADTSGDDFHRTATKHPRETVLRSKRFQLRPARDVKKMLDGLAPLQFSRRQASPLQKLCEAGSEYGVRILEKTVSSELLSLLRPKAKRRLKDGLRQILARVTRLCLALEFDAFRCAHQAIHPQRLSLTPKLIEKKFLGERPYDRLISLFNKFPVLAELWSQLICYWGDSVSDLLARIEADKQELSRVFFRGQPIAEIVDLRGALSDPHNKGRTVMRVQFQVGSIIYKPRSGDGEREWFNLVGYLNAASFQPKLSAARVLCRNDYCWMEDVKATPCTDTVAARRFYKRLGGMIAAAYLVRAVDCHRDNLIASGEHPVLVDAETLWHVDSKKKARRLLDVLYATGFFPTSARRSSYEYRSSALGRTRPGKHTAYINSEPLHAGQYESEIVDGFCKAWRCLLSTTGRRAVFGRRLQRLRDRKRRRIYSSTRAYDAIMQASIQPAALRSGIDRNLLIARSCTRPGVPQKIIREETNALKRLDIPYFISRASGGSPFPENNAGPAEITEALRRALRR